MKHFHITRQYLDDQGYLKGEPKPQRSYDICSDFKSGYWNLKQILELITKGFIIRHHQDTNNSNKYILLITFTLFSKDPVKDAWQNYLSNYPPFLI